METLNMIRLIIGILAIGMGTIVFCLELFGVYRFRFILNRMHFAGTGDTMGLAFIMIGAAIVNGFDWGSLKFLLVLVFFWFASPVSSHLIARLVLDTTEDLDKHVKVLDEEESKKYLNGEEQK